MAVEIERKFLLKNQDWKKLVQPGVEIVQAYLNTEKERTVRVRIYGAAAFLTIKGKSEGIARAEFEYPIPKEDALQLMKLSKEAVIEKKRYLLLQGKHTWEIDEFYGANEGLFLAEIELTEESEAFDRPAWLGKEVSEDPRFYNSSLVLQPFKSWKDSF